MKYFPSAVIHGKAQIFCSYRVFGPVKNVCACFCAICQTIKNLTICHQPVDLIIPNSTKMFGNLNSVG